MFWRNLEIRDGGARWPPQLKNDDVITRHTMSSTNFVSVKGNSFGHAMYPLSFIVIPFMHLKLIDFKEVSPFPPPHPPPPKKKNTKAQVKEG